MTPIPPVVMRRYIGDDSEERADFFEVEVNQAEEVDLIASPYTEDAQTFSLPVPEAWKLCREIVRAIVAAEQFNEG